MMDQSAPSSQPDVKLSQSSNGAPSDPTKPRKQIFTVVSELSSHPVDADSSASNIASQKSGAFVCKGSGWVVVTFANPVRVSSVTVKNHNTPFLAILGADISELQSARKPHPKCCLTKNSHPDCCFAKNSRPDCVDLKVLVPPTQLVSLEQHSTAQPRACGKTRSFRNFSKYINTPTTTFTALVFLLTTFPNWEASEVGLGWVEVYGTSPSIPRPDKMIDSNSSSQTSQEEPPKRHKGADGTVSHSMFAEEGIPREITEAPSCPTHNQPCILRADRSAGAGKMNWTCTDPDCTFRTTAN